MVKKKRESSAFRIERDIMGAVRVPKDAYYGVFTTRAAANFPISGLRIHRAMNEAYIQIKIAAAKSNDVLKQIEKRKAAAIVRAGQTLLKRYEDYADQFVVDVFQAGAGTPWHMNVNEVIANVALQHLGKKKGSYDIIDPHDHVNFGQSSNDVTPTALRIATLQLAQELLTEIKQFIVVLKAKARQFQNVRKTARTHLMDAVPITLGKEFGAWAANVAKREETLKESLRNVRQLPLGGTAVGTGLNTHPRFAAQTVKHLKQQTKLPLMRATNVMIGMQFMSDFLDVSAALRTLATDIHKIAGDVMLLGSGPTAGLHEIMLPQVEPGSSIMPSKFNPSMAEMMHMVCFQAMGNDVAIQRSAQAGQLDLNVMAPVLAHNLLESLEILTSGIAAFREKCIRGITAEYATLQKYFEQNPTVGTVLNRVVGYEKAAALIAEALRTHKNIQTLVVEKKILTQKEADAIFSDKNLRLR